MLGDWRLEHLYHTVVNVKDLDESIAFYKLLGFEILNDRRHIEWPDFVATNFGMKRAKGRGVLMVLPNLRGECRLAWARRKCPEGLKNRP